MLISTVTIRDSSYAARVKLAAQVQTIEGALEYLRVLHVTNDFNGLEAIIETHFRDDPVLYRSFRDRNYVLLVSLLMSRAAERTHALPDFNLKPGATSEQLKNEARSILVLRYLTRIAQQIRMQEPEMGN